MSTTLQSSIIDRIFPPSRASILPQHERNHASSTSPRRPLAASSDASRSPARSRRVSPPQSERLQAAPLSASVMHHSDPFLPIDRAAKALERHIQSLLDAQLDGLAARLGSGQDDVSSTGSHTPTASSFTGPASTLPTKTIPIRQPPNKKVGLQGARKRLAKSMREFSLLRQEEIKVLNQQITERSSVLEEIEKFGQRRSGLDGNIAQINKESESQTARTFRAEADMLEAEIRRLEDELLEKKARHRQLMNRANEAQSSVQSKLSSFQSSLNLLDANVKEFLERPPIEHSLGIHDRGLPAEDFYTLSPKRRTLDMAKEHWQGENALLAARRDQVEAEISALTNGVDVWREVCEEVTSLEKWLRGQTKDLSKSDHSTEDSLREVLRRIDLSTNFVQTRFRLAEDKNWNLLVCCIGGELEALQEGRELLEQTSRVARNGNGDADQEPATSVLMHANDNIPIPNANSSNESLKDTLQEMYGTTHKQPIPSQEAVPTTPTLPYAQSESEDDGPAPDLLISHRED